ncbi:MAG TPA: hypothetical protein VLC91_02935, partial [Spongiibacteraceae bacterium]|nr:hypothetical protein [Spongiibacteraceae bacterium]
MANPISHSDPIGAQLQAPGAAFEIEEIQLNGIGCRVFRRSPPTLNAIFAGAQQFSEREFIVYNDARISYGEAFAKAAALAATITQQIGVTKGTRIA